jgi:hypothetical protein
MTEVWLTWVGFYRQVMHLGGGCRGSCVASDWSDFGFCGEDDLQLWNFLYLGGGGDG